jgi:putative ATP-dependent endonuclease of OLD family
MKIKTIRVCGFRSLEKATLSDCGRLNVLIGKNNSGKSNLLATIDLVHRHLLAATIAAHWPTPRPADEFTDRRSNQPLQIGVEFELPPELNTALRERLKTDAPLLEKSIEQIAGHNSLSVVISGVRLASKAFLFLQHLGAGTLRDDGGVLSVTGIGLLSVPHPVGQELFMFREESTILRADLKALERLLEQPNIIENLINRREGRYYIQALYGLEMRPQLVRQVEQAATASTTPDELRTRLGGMIAATRENIEEVEHRETAGSMSTFAGAAKMPPAYAIWLMKECGSVSMLYLRERRDPIGREEAEALLTLKVTRGGPERLQAVQKTVRSLLGVDVDAFQSDTARRSPSDRGAEMDIDQFLVEANGAGVREALRLILDLELKRPRLLLLEEPEIHLHPGLEHAIYSYLRERSQGVQMFVTTHSTNFVDSVSFQNIYLVARNDQGRTVLEQLDSGDGALRIPAELGLRLSTVFMYDRLLFVEGPSDEAVLRELAKTLDLDLAGANVGFVQMGGVRNFAHFAAQGTIDLLARRRIRLCFVADRDERDDDEVQEMVRRLGTSATLVVLERRELENYLLEPDAVARFIREKRVAAGLGDDGPPSEEVAVKLAEEARKLQSEVIRLRFEAVALRPIFLRVRGREGDARERLDRAATELGERIKELERVREGIKQDVEHDWDQVASSRAPGSLILDAVARSYGVRFTKESGDSARLARHLRLSGVVEELRRLLRDIAQADVVQGPR